MRLTGSLAKLMHNLNKPYWNRRPWERVGYAGSPLGSIGGKTWRRTIYPVEGSHVQILQQRFEIEYNVMRHLTRVYLDEDKERPYVKQHGDILDQWNAQEVAKKQAKMPGKPKLHKIADGRLEKRRSNVGNLLQAHRSIEDTMEELIQRDRWD